MKGCSRETAWNFSARSERSREPNVMRPYRILALLAAMLLSGCSVKRFAINKVGDSLANSGTTYASDDDPDLVGHAVPFGLKLMEALLAVSPNHAVLLFAASSGFAE